MSSDSVSSDALGSDSVSSDALGSDVRRPIRRALISVYDKTGLDGLIKALGDAGVQIVSTGKTAQRIADLGFPVTRVEELTGFPECLDGRVKTLHPKVHAGLLADLRLAEHGRQLTDLGIEPFDLLVSNLYPFEETVASGADFDGCVEQIDIGGPAMVRAAAKNHASVTVVTSPTAYPMIIDAGRDGGTTLTQRRALAARAFADIARYAVAIANWFTARQAGAVPAGAVPAGAVSTGAERASGAEQRTDAGQSGAGQVGVWPEFAGQATERATILRYGENPHQRAALYTDPSRPAGLAQARQVHGKEMSYNNYVDADAAWRSANDFTEPCVAIIKHANPCGIAIGPDIAQAHAKAHACDPVSAYGGIVAANREVTVELARQLDGVLTEVIVAPSYQDDALEVLRAKKNIRILIAPQWTPEPVEWRLVSGGMLAQTADRIGAPGDDPATWQLVAGAPADPTTLADLGFAWRAVRSVKSNAILLAAGGASVGVGMGQVNRVDSARLAISRAGDRVAGSVAASDAFFPFPDGLQVLLDGGVRAVAQPGGSIRDGLAVETAQQAGVTMYFTGTRHFYH